MLQDNSAEVLFASMSENPHHLEHPHLGGNHLTGVDPVLIGRSLFGLKTINLCGTKLTWDQISVDLALIFNSNTLEFGVCYTYIHTTQSISTYRLGPFEGFFEAK